VAGGGASPRPPYPDGRKIATISIHSASDMFIRRTYTIRPYPDRRKIATISIHSAHNDQKIATILIRLPHSSLKIATILIH